MANETLNIQNGVSPITIDTEVTEGSMRPVTSDGIYKAIRAGDPLVGELIARSNFVYASTLSFDIMSRAIEMGRLVVLQYSASSGAGVVPAPFSFIGTARYYIGNNIILIFSCVMDGSLRYITFSSGSNEGTMISTEVGTYSKPEDGIPATDLTNTIQQQLARTEVVYVHFDTSSPAFDYDEVYEPFTTGKRTRVLDEADRYYTLTKWSANDGGIQFLTWVNVDIAHVRTVTFLEDDRQIYTEVRLPAAGYVCDFGSSFETTLAGAQMMASQAGEATLASYISDASAPFVGEEVERMVAAVRSGASAGGQMSGVYSGVASVVSASDNRVTFSFSHPDITINSGSLTACDTYEFTLELIMDRDGMGNYVGYTGIVHCAKHTATIV